MANRSIGLPNYRELSSAMHWAGPEYKQTVSPLKAIRTLYLREGVCRTGQRVQRDICVQRKSEIAEVHDPQSLGVGL